MSERSTSELRPSKCSRNTFASEIAAPVKVPPWLAAPFHTYIHTYINTYIHQYIHTSIHTYIYTYINTYIHTSQTGLSTGSSTLGVDRMVSSHHVYHRFIEHPFYGCLGNCGRFGAIGSSPSNGLKPNM